MPPRLKFLEVKEYFEKHGCTLLEEEYKDTLTKMKYKCKCGNISEIRYSSFQQGCRCKKCGGTEKLIYSDVKAFYEKQGCELLENDYTNNRTKMKYRCKCGNISSMTFNHFKNGKRCKKCSGTEKHLYENVKKYFEEHNCTLLEEEYKNALTKMRYICVCGRESSIHFNNFMNGHRCTKCLNKTERIVSDFLEETYENIIYQPTFEWCKDKKCFPFDFLLDDYRILLEIDGIQHFEQVSNWDTPEYTQKRDLFKMECALKHNYRIIRIFQEDILYNRIDWKFLLKNAISSDEEVIFISKNSELYKNYI